MPRRPTPDRPDPVPGPLGAARRAALARARTILIFTPEVLAAPDPEAALARALAHVDVVQVRTKLPGARVGPSPARLLFEWTRRVLDLTARLPEGARPLVTVDDRVDVAAALAPAGVAGVHLGDRDCPPAIARELLGPDALIGWSTHALAEVDAAAALPVDYLGFGPVAATATKGLTAALGPDLARAAAERCARPVFAIGGVDAALAARLAPTGRVAVGAAILDADDPASAAQALRAALSGATSPD